MRRWTHLAAGLVLTGCGVGGTSDEQETSGGSTSSAADTTTSGSTSTQESSSESGVATTGAPPGCGKDPGFAGAAVGGIEAMGLERRYTLVLPDGYDPNTQYAFVYGLHGRGSDGEQFRAYNGVEEASAGAAIFVYPDGLPVESMGGVTGWELNANDRDVAFFDAMHTEFTENLCIDPERVFATGHSFGGFFSNALGCIRGDIIRAIGSVSGGGPGAACSGATAAWIAHGEGDEIVDLFLGQMSRNYWVGVNGCAEETEPVDPEPCVEYQGCDEGSEVTWCQHAVESQGIGTHGWPPFAGAAIWEFFARY